MWVIEADELRSWPADEAGGGREIEGEGARTMTLFLVLVSSSFSSPLPHFLTFTRSMAREKALVSENCLVCENKGERMHSVLRAPAAVKSHSYSVCALSSTTATGQMGR